MLESKLRRSADNIENQDAPEVDRGGVQFATAQLPLLELMDCGMTIRDHYTDHPSLDVPKSRLHLIYKKLIVKHNRLRKLSLWGCSGLDMSKQNPVCVNGYSMRYYACIIFCIMNM